MGYVGVGIEIGEIVSLRTGDDDTIDGADNVDFGVRDGDGGRTSSTGGDFIFVG